MNRKILHYVRRLRDINLALKNADITHDQLKIWLIKNSYIADITAV